MRPKKLLMCLAGSAVVGWIAARSRVMGAGAKAMAKVNRDPLRFLHGYIYFRWQKSYLGFLKWGMERPDRMPRWLYDGLGGAVARTHHSKVLSPADARQLVQVGESICLENLERVIPFEVARSVILDAGEDIAVMECPCRSLSADPCLPLDVCLVLGQATVGFVLEKKTQAARRVTQDEALAILEREHCRGRVHTAWFKDAAGDRFYSVCSCCRCCCLGMKATLNYGLSVVAPSGRVAVVERESCSGCGECSGCIFGALSVDGVAAVDVGRCMGCGQCVAKCGAGAVRLVPDPSKPEPLDIRALTSRKAESTSMVEPAVLPE